jgi:undecaprenyl pyrophosphate synthase
VKLNTLLNICVIDTSEEPNADPNPDVSGFVKKNTSRRLFFALLAGFAFREEMTQAVRRAVEMVDRGVIREDEIDEKLLGRFPVNR